MNTPPPDHIAFMQSLVRRLGKDREAVCGAYAEAELDGLVSRIDPDGDVTPAVYAATLWAQGERTGWLDAGAA